MGILVKDDKLNWLPNNSFHWRFISDVLKVTETTDHFNWLRDEAMFINEAHLYTLDLREASLQKLIDVLEVTSLIVYRNENLEESGHPELLYKDELHSLRNNLRSALVSFVDDH